MKMSDEEGRQNHETKTSPHLRFFFFFTESIDLLGEELWLVSFRKILIVDLREKSIEKKIVSSSLQSIIQSNYYLFTWISDDERWRCLSRVVSTIQKINRARKSIDPIGFYRSTNERSWTKERTNREEKHLILIDAKLCNEFSSDFHRQWPWLAVPMPNEWFV